ncbi:Hypothetical protein SCF082_LOCUS36062 [Durusdinium trenchii]|uniref:Uncharacterized protein n=1 Tax=Durusdinium trenchii TaxID=1381693 RepID=A0ABP0PDJ9_9DINO
MALLATILLAHCSPSGASLSGWAQQVENFTSHAWSQIMAEDGAKPTEAQHTAYGWNWAAVCLGSFLVLCPACGCLCCTYAGILEDDFGAGSWLHDYEPLVCEDSEAGAKQQIQAKVARREMRMMLLLPLLPLLALPYTTCSEGSPLWLYAIYVPFLLRSKYVELELMQALPAEFPDQAESALPWGFWLWLDFLVFGPLEHLDFFTDGAAPIQAWYCDADLNVSDRLAAAWAESGASWVAPLVQRFRLWGLMAAVFVMGATAQLSIGTLDAEFACDSATLLGYAKLRDRYQRENSMIRRAVVSISKVFLENILQLMLQTSLLALVFDYLTPPGRAKALFSISLGLFSAVKSTANGLIVFISFAVCYSCFALPLLALNLVGLAVVAWTLLKLLHIFQCPSHLWNFTGCVRP